MIRAHFETMEGTLLQSGPSVDFSTGEVAGLAFDLGDDWEISDEAVVLFAGGQLPIPRPVPLENGVCTIPPAALSGRRFTFTLIGQLEGRTVISSNSLEVDLEEGSVSEVNFTPVSVDLLALMWDFLDTGSFDGSNAGSNAGSGESSGSGTAAAPGVTPEQLVQAIAEHANQAGLHVSGSDRSNWDSKLSLNPTAGIPSVAVQQANPNVLYWEE
jgi:hypothetical protein